MPFIVDRAIDAIDGYTLACIPNLSMVRAQIIFFGIMMTRPRKRMRSWLIRSKQLIAPVQISQITSQNGSNQLAMANVPIGLNGIVLGSTNLALTNWTTVTSFNSTNSAQSVFVPISGPLQFYRLNFPFAWTWP